MKLPPYIGTIKFRNFLFGLKGIIIGAMFMIFSVNIPQPTLCVPENCGQITSYQAYQFLTVFIIGLAFIGFGIFALTQGMQRQNPVGNKIDVSRR